MADMHRGGGRGGVVGVGPMLSSRPPHFWHWAALPFGTTSEEFRRWCDGIVPRLQVGGRRCEFAALALDPMIHAPEAYMDSIAGCFCTRGIRDWELPACMQLNSVEFNGNIQNSFQRIQLHVAAGGEVE
jgi:hypothetical protein